MSRMPVVAALVLVTMTTAAGCVALSPQPARSGGVSHVTEPRLGQEPARESLADTGDGRSRDPNPGGAAPDSARPAGVTPGPSGAAWPDGGRGPGAGGTTGSESGRPDSHDSQGRWGEPSGSALPTVRVPGPDHRVTVPAAPPPARPAPPPAPAPPPPRAEPRPAPEPRPPAPAPAPGARPGMCALGESYGHWQQGGDASRICRQVYGR
ncbi:hypothetical protein ACIHFE_28390 [Streptomyces sp. NPDC052396]|uniref:hypothetical protein n=1 Tax=Streptomyces sp. NPDC052396 TaxID=3365689 RepID=UPI0037D98389